MPIFDQGYQHWSGDLTGHAWRWLAITRHGVRVAMSNRFLRLLLLLAWFPASAFAAALCLWGLIEQKSTMIASILPLLDFIDAAILKDPLTYRVEIWTLCYHYFLMIELFISMVLIVLVGPNLISQDLRYNAIPLYLSRPLRRVDYFFGKLGVIVAVLSLVTLVPSVVAYVLGLLFSLDFSIIGDTYHLLLASLFYGLIISVSAGTLILALSSLSRNSRYVALFWLGLWLVSGSVSGLLEGLRYEEIARESMRQEMHPGGFTMHVFDETARQKLERESAASNWRPLISYTANLTRLEYALLDTNQAWATLLGVLPRYAASSMLSQYQGPSYPWQWSAGVLLGLFGLSVCILNRSVKSLDRLK
jgi:ABC-2 type transport system permease protein